MQKREDTTQRHDFATSKSNLSANPHCAPWCPRSGHSFSFGHILIDDSWCFNVISVQGNHADKWLGKQGLWRHDSRVLEVSPLKFHSGGNRTRVSKFSVRHQHAAMLPYQIPKSFALNYRSLFELQRADFIKTRPARASILANMLICRWSSVGLPHM